jgi:aminoglycoside phosphotransferase (APT) family kinase protein
VADLHSTPEDACAVAEHALGRRTLAAERDRVGASNDVYFVTLADGEECVVRIGRAEWRYLVPQEVWAVGRCRALGVPAPDVLAADWSLAHFPWPYTVARRLPGRVLRRRDLTPPEIASLLEQMGGYLRLIHSVELAGHGNLIETGDSYTGRHASAWEALRDDMEHRIAHLPPGLLPDERVGRVRALVERERDLFALDGAVLVHGDFQGNNVLVSDGRVTGVLDFENLVAGDPALDFKPVHFHSDAPTRDLAALRRGYGDRPGLFDDRFERRLLVYELVFALELLWWKTRFGNTAGAAELVAKLDRIEEALAE